jgi:tetratricopeptide (TPR) repeat protein
MGLEAFGKNGTTLREVKRAASQNSCSRVVLGSALAALSVIQGTVAWGSPQVSQDAPEQLSPNFSLPKPCQATIKGSQELSGLLKDATIHPTFEGLNSLGLSLAQGKQYSCAIPAFEAALRLDPKSWETHYNLALALGLTGEQKRAASELRIVVQQKPDYFAAYNVLGLALQSQGDLEAAAEQFKVALRIDPHSPLAAFNLARVFHSQEKYATEVYYLRQALASSPPKELEFRARLALGAVQDELGHADEAVAELRKLVAAFPDSAEAHFNLGNAYGRHFRYKEARVEYEQTLRLDASFDAARLSLAKALLEMGEDTAAIPIVQDYTRRAPGDYEGQLVLGQAYRRQGDLGKAAEHLGRAVELKPDSYDARYNLGIVFARTGDINAATRQLEAAEKLNPRAPGAHYELSRIYAKQKLLQRSKDEAQAFQQARDWTEEDRTFDLLRIKGDDSLRKGDARSAAETYREAIRVNAKDPGMHYNLSLALAQLGDRQGEKQELEKAIQLGPNEAEPHNQLGTLYMVEERVDEAEKEFKSAIALNPTFAEAKNNLGTLYGRIGNNRAAIELFREAVQNNLLFAQAHANLGLALAAGGNFAEGGRELQEALRIDPKNETALAGLRMLKAQTDKGSVPPHDAKKHDN